MGKSITSYLTGHAICQGYIKSVDAPIEDWPLMENTLYYGQPLINLLNMQAGDTHIIKELDGRFIKSGRAIHGNGPLSMAVRNPKELKDTKATKECSICIQ
jgi:CubicO group peptidase (beta-lactamase class C family)